MTPTREQLVMRVAFLACQSFDPEGGTTCRDRHGCDVVVWNIRGWWLCVFCHKRETGGV